MLNLWAATTNQQQSSAHPTPDHPASQNQNKRKIKNQDPPARSSKHAKVDHLATEDVQTVNAASSTESILVLSYEPAQAPPQPPSVEDQILSPSEATEYFKPNMYWSQHITNELGIYAASCYWRDELDKARQSTDSTSTPEALSQLQHMVDTLSANPTSVIEHNVSSKFLHLTQVISSCRAYGDKFRAVVFVKSPLIASYLVKVLEYWLSQGQLSFVRPLVFDGSLETSSAFTRDIHNVLIVSEDLVDLDIPPAPVCIFYEMYSNPLALGYALVQHIPKRTHLVCFSERGNSTHRRALEWLNTKHADIFPWCQSLSSNSQNRFPTWEAHHSRTLAAHKLEDGSEFIQDHVTGCKMGPQDALFAINRIACESPLDDPLFELKNDGSSFTCSVRLLGSVQVGPPSPTPCIARRRACFSACTTLYKQSLLKYQQFPVYAQNYLHRNMQSSSQAEPIKHPDDPGEPPNTYLVVRRKPPYRDFCQRSSLKSYIPHLVSISSKNHRPFLLLMNLSLPPFPETQLGQEDHSPKLRFHTGEPFILDDSRLELLQRYSARVFSALLNKPFPPEAKYEYLLAPVSADILKEGLEENQLGDHILWDEVNLASQRAFVPLLGGESQNIEDAIQDAAIQDMQVEITRRYEILSLRRDLSPLSRPSIVKNGETYETYIQYLKANRKGFEGLKDEKQPLLEVSPLVVPKNPFQPVQDQPQSNQRMFIPELCAKSVIPASAFRTFLYLPAIFQVIEDLLLTIEINAAFFNNDISVTILREALTTPNAVRGLDYQRLELLGDSILKYLASLYVFATHPLKSESSLHVTRRAIVSNQALFRRAISAGIAPFIQWTGFSSSRWNPMQIPTSSTKEGEVQNLKSEKKNRSARRRKTAPAAEQAHLGDKVIADVCEAIIGASFLTGGLDMAFDTCKDMKLGFPRLDKWHELASHIMVASSSTCVEPRLEAIKAIEDTVGFKFQRRHLLVQALTHPTRNGAGDATYERLEYAGDAILDLMVVKYIFQLHPNYPPSKLTLLKSAMVSNTTLAAISVKAGFHQYLLHSSPSLAELIRKYVSELDTAQAKQKDKDTRKAPYWDNLDAPKENVVESLLAAAFLSEECSMAGVEAFWNNLLQPFYETYISLSALPKQTTEVLDKDT